MTAGGFLAAAGLHFALADYAGDVEPAAAQAMNAIDNDFAHGLIDEYRLLIFPLVLGEESYSVLAGVKQGPRLLASAGWERRYLGPSSDNASGG